MGGSSSSDRQASEASRFQMEMARALFNQTDPLRRNLISQSQDFLSGDQDVSASPVFRAMRSQIEGQYGVARNNIIGDTPTGGALTQALVELEGGRADALTQGAGQVAGSELDRALALATGQTGTAAYSAAGGAASAAQLAQARSQRDAGLYSSIGGAAGALLGNMGGKD